MTKKIYLFSDVKMPKKPFSGKAKKAQLAAKKNKQLGKKSKMHCLGKLSKLPPPPLLVRTTSQVKLYGNLLVYGLLTPPLY